MIRVLAFALCLTGSPLAAEKLRLAVTTSFQNSGLADILIPAFAADSGIDVQVLAVGSGQALRLGSAGDVDAVLVHAEAAEKAFIAAGHSPYRVPIMYNDFVVVGPQSDPAGITLAADAAQALNQIAEMQTAFVSRGDNSGTHLKELEIWEQSNQNPANFGAWYLSVGSSMGASLNMASSIGAYVLSDRASWLNFGNKGELAILFEGDPVLFNQYSFLPISKGADPQANAKQVAALEGWLISARAKHLINSYQLAGEQLFVFNYSGDLTGQH